MKYDRSFYDDQKDGSASSAQVVVPLFLSLFQAGSAVDVGCGVGTWLQAFKDNGVTEILGIDGAYIPRDMLRIEQDEFLPLDLSEPIRVERRYDVACSLEVAEHLPASCADRLVADLVRLAPVVLFSAAIPGQGGTHHVNEQWQSYWVARFQAHDYVALDCIRPAIFDDDRVDWWYRQNVLVFCRERFAPEGARRITSAYDSDRVDPTVLASRQAIVDWYEEKLAEERAAYASALERQSSAPAPS